MVYGEQDLLKLTKAISRVSGVEIVFPDRTSLPFENEFGGGADYAFSDNEKRERAKAIRAIVFSQSGYDLLEDLELDAYGYEYASKSNPVAVIFGNSPYLTDQEYWRNLTGVSVHYSHRKSIESITHLHELVHFIRGPKKMRRGEYAEPKDKALLLEFAECAWFATPDKPACSEIEARYNEESAADVGAIRYYLRHNGGKDGADDFIRARHLAAFFSNSPSNYWTAMACEAALRNEPFPPYKTVTRVVRTLQMMVWQELEAKPVDPLETMKLVESLEREDAGAGNDFHAVDPKDTIGVFLRQYSLPDVICALNRVVKSPKLVGDASKEIKVEGTRLLRACRHFCYNDFEEACRREWEAQRVARRVERLVP